MLMLKSRQTFESLVNQTIQRPLSDFELFSDDADELVDIVRCREIDRQTDRQQTERHRHRHRQTERDRERFVWSQRENKRELVLKILMKPAYS